MKRRTVPSQTLMQGKPYRPSWTHVPVTTWTPRLGGHFGLVGHLKPKGDLQ